MEKIHDICLSMNLPKDPVGVNDSWVRFPVYQLNRDGMNISVCFDAWLLMHLRRTEDQMYSLFQGKLKNDEMYLIHVDEQFRLNAIVYDFQLNRDYFTAYSTGQHSSFLKELAKTNEVVFLEELTRFWDAP